MKACFSGDNETTLPGCPLNNTLSKAFTGKGADCYLGFLGENKISNCPTGCESCESDVWTPASLEFTHCFWNRILIGDTIKQAAVWAEDLGNCPKTGNKNNNYVLVNSTMGGCDENI
jgi:hypothetical protein